MTNEKEEKIKEKIRESIRKIAGNGGYGYLDCFETRWKDYQDKIHDLEEMSSDYLDNCLGELKRGDKFANLGFDTIAKQADFRGFRFSPKDKEFVKEMAVKELRTLMLQKKKEIEDELKSRV
ncbi:hypothetical protein [Clostridium butyricum]|jgi:hypothetical protein|uniref:hypothetical protein n=1 Tax=Clostridium butyricum TaxID=1492 RepID=UPI000DEB71E8|nr:hypothetical protein [Clostridium butyricum]AXB84579.1 hypothetical protein DRB99_06250 [Clostridium butyricum]